MVNTDLKPKKIPTIDFLHFQHHVFGYIVDEIKD